VWYNARPFAKIKSGVSVVKTCEAVTFYQKATGLCSKVVPTGDAWEKWWPKSLEVLFMLVASFGVLSTSTVVQSSMSMPCFGRRSAGVTKAPCIQWTTASGGREDDVMACHD
jgi:hypothetical protein